MDVFFGPEFSESFQRHPLTLVDVGASGGLQSHWQRAEKHLRVIAFEPDERAYADLTSSAGSGSTVYVNTGLYDECTTLPFYVTRRQAVSSLLKPNEKYVSRFPGAGRFDILKMAEVDVDTLDSQLCENQIGDVDFIKLDTQGSELPILRGATGILLDSVFGVEVEVDFAPIYEDQPVFADVDRFVRESGFVQFGLNPHYWRRTAGKDLDGSSGQIVFADALYLRDLDGIEQLIGQSQDDLERKSKLLRAMSVCMVYDRGDYALEIAEANSGVFSRHENRLLQDSITRGARGSRKLPRFRGSRRVANVLFRAGRLFEPRNRGWG